MHLPIYLLDQLFSIHKLQHLENGLPRTQSSLLKQDTNYLTICKQSQETLALLTGDWFNVPKCYPHILNDLQLSLQKIKMISICSNVYICYIQIHTYHFLNLFMLSNKMLNCCHLLEKLTLPSGRKSLLPIWTNVRSWRIRPLEGKTLVNKQS